MTYEETLKKIHSFNVFGSRLGLERMTALLELLGNPHEKLNVIHVAGTNGKGSVCRYVYSALKECGYLVGAYFSPFIERFTERIEFDGEEISQQDLIKYSQIVFEKTDMMIDRGFESPTEFELVTAIGLLYFAEKKTDFVILEVGLGGIGDSTNVCAKPVATAITSISFDHMAQLGNTLTEIASNKAGIIKEGVPVIVCVDNKDAKAVIQSYAKKMNAPFVDVRKCRADDIQSDLAGYSFKAYLDMTALDEKAGQMDLGRINLSMAGRHQIDNALCALCILETVRLSGYEKIELDYIKKGMHKAVQAGRFEIKRFAPNISENSNDEKYHYMIFDGAHNPAGAKALTDTVLAHFKGSKILLCTGILEDKKYEDMVQEFSYLNADVIVTDVPNPRTMPAEKLAGVFEQYDIYSDGKNSITAVPNLKDALELAWNKRFDYDVILWAGSLYLVGAVKNLYQENWG